MTPKLEILWGPIASGKSTYARQRAKEGAIVVNDDAIVLALHSGDYSLYSEDLKNLYKTVEHTILHDALAHGRDVIIDRPNHKKNTRMRFALIGKSVGVTICLVKFPQESVEIHAERRYNSDSRGYTIHQWEEVVRRHLLESQKPDGEEFQIYDEILEPKIDVTV